MPEQVGTDTRLRRGGEERYDELHIADRLAVIFEVER
jgi:hypothetical protein